MRLKTSYTIFLHIISSLFVITQADFVSKNDFFELVHTLRSSIKGYVLYRGSPDYETARQSVVFLQRYICHTCESC